MNPALYQFAILDATFRPQRTDNLQNDAESWIGFRGHWECLWIIEDGEYAGQWAIQVARDLEQMKKGVYDYPPFLWVPECDLEIHAVMIAG